MSMLPITTKKVLSTQIWRLAFAAIGTALPIVVDAQSDAQTIADLRTCQQLERDSARLACFDGVLAPLGEAEAGASARSPSPAPVQVPVQAQTRAERRAASSAADDEAEEISVVIVEVLESSLGRKTFVASDGRVWVQTGGNAGLGRYPTPPFDTVLQRGTFGSYFLVSPLGGAKVRVSARD